MLDDWERGNYFLCIFHPFLMFYLSYLLIDMTVFLSILGLLLNNADIKVVVQVINH